MVSTRRSAAALKSPVDTPRQKNRVASLKLLKSPDIVSAARREDDDLSVDTSLASAASSTKSRPGLPRYVQKALAEAIEVRGGIAVFKSKAESKQAIKLICKADPDTFGKKGDSIRTQARK